LIDRTCGVFRDALNKDDFQGKCGAKVKNNMLFFPGFLEIKVNVFRIEI
jgi:hypothetical protein